MRMSSFLASIYDRLNWLREALNHGHPTQQFKFICRYRSCKRVMSSGRIISFCLPIFAAKIVNAWCFFQCCRSQALPLDELFAGTDDITAKGCVWYGTPLHEKSQAAGTNGVVDVKRAWIPDHGAKSEVGLFISIQVKVEGAKIPLHRVAKFQLLGNGWKWCMLHDVRSFSTYFNTF